MIIVATKLIILLVFMSALKDFITSFIKIDGYLNGNSFCERYFESFHNTYFSSHISINKFIITQILYANGLFYDYKIAIYLIFISIIQI